MKYQDLILGRLAEIAGDVAPTVQTSTSLDYSNNGRLVAHDGPTLSTLATLDFDFQRETVRMSLNNCVRPGQPLNGPRSSEIFWWTPGSPEDDGEVARLMNAWEDAVRAKLGKSPEPDYRPIAAAAGLEMFAGVLDVLHNRETVPPDVLASLSPERITELYEGRIAPAIDEVEADLLSMGRKETNWDSWLINQLRERGHKATWEHPGALCIELLWGWDVWTGMTCWDSGSVNRFVEPENAMEPTDIVAEPSGVYDPNGEMNLSDHGPQILLAWNEWATRFKAAQAVVEAEHGSIAGLPPKEQERLVNEAFQTLAP